MKDKDVNYLSYADVDGVTIGDQMIVADQTKFDDSLKLSHATNFKGYNLTIYGGSENAIDLNRECKMVLFEHLVLVGGGQCAIVVKGGSEDIEFTNVCITKPKGNYDIELGGWSDQSRKKTKRVWLDNVVRPDGKPVRVVVGNADKPTIIGGNVKILFWRSLALKAFVWAKGLVK